jgi:hypothetical protein
MPYRPLLFGFGIFNFTVLEVDYPKELQYDEDDGDNNQSMDPIAGARNSGANIPAESAEQPQYDEYHDDSPQHERPPLEWSSRSIVSHPVG